MCWCQNLSSCTFKSVCVSTNFTPTGIILYKVEKCCYVEPADIQRHGEDQRNPTSNRATAHHGSNCTSQPQTDIMKQFSSVKHRLQSRLWSNCATLGPDLHNTREGGTFKSK